MTIDDDPSHRRGASTPAQPPAFNVPPVVLAFILLLAGVQAARSLLIGPVADDRLVADFAFIPGCYAQACDLLFDRPLGALVWSPLTHALLHGDWTHLGLNTIWLLAFGSPVARRLRAARFLAFSAAGALAGAGAFFVINQDLVEPVIGASGVVSALMGGACRFAISGIGQGRLSAARLPRLTIAEALSDRTILFFVAVFFATNLLTASAVGGLLSDGAAIAWEAHIGGFAFGFLGFTLFDRQSTDRSMHADSSS